MQIDIIEPRKALNKAYLKVKPRRSDIDRFKTNLIRLIDSIDNARDEEYHKTKVRDFLKNTCNGDQYYFNVQQNIDWAIFNGPKSTDSVGVLIATKKPSNKTEMLTKDNLNTKAFHELILYYLQEKITNKNLEIKHIIATNIYEWFIFDAVVFDRLFAQHTPLAKKFNDFEERRLAGSNTDLFYKEIAETFVDESFPKFQTLEKIAFTHFDIRDYEKALTSNDKSDENKLIVLYKLLSPEHLLKLPLVNNSNSPDKAFHSELLHLIGLSETKKGSKKVIGRKPERKRDAGSLLENAIAQLDSMDKISRLPNPSQYGGTCQEQLFNVALELTTTWVNRILFLKVLEAKLVSYHNNDESFSFLNINKVKNYDGLNSLFFSILTRKPEERIGSVKAQFAHVPYLNGSLFETSHTENNTIVISNLGDELKLPMFSSTVLKDNNGRRRAGEMNALEYFFEFLDAYDFSSEGSGEIQEDNKPLINSSVLGLIFERINSYRGGVSFTFHGATTYTWRKTIRKAVVQKFNEAKMSFPLSAGPVDKATPQRGKGSIRGIRGEEYKSLKDIYEAIGTDFTRQEANEIINGLKICDPAVGSGHFLVSVLNEIIAIKSELKVLFDRSGKTLSNYHIEVANDELVVTHDDGKLFKYHSDNKKSQRVQEALFHEKQTIIGNCLFGMDNNSGSVEICRLRLWMELLKHSYFVQKETRENSSPVCYAESENLREGYELPVIRQLQALPDLNINILDGNSLISGFDVVAGIDEC